MLCSGLGARLTSRARTSLPARGSLDSAAGNLSPRPLCSTAGRHDHTGQMTNRLWVTRFRQHGDDASQKPSEGDRITSELDTPLEPNSDSRGLLFWSPERAHRVQQPEGGQLSQSENQNLANPWAFLKRAVRPNVTEPTHQHQKEPKTKQPSDEVTGNVQETGLSADLPDFSSVTGVDHVHNEDSATVLTVPEESPAVAAFAEQPELDTDASTGSSLEIRGSDPAPEKGLEKQQQPRAVDNALPPTALIGAELLESAPATPIILAQTLDDKVAEIIARYRLMQDRLAAVERQMLDLVQELRASPPGTVLAVVPTTVPTMAPSVATDAATAEKGPASASWGRDSAVEDAEKAPLQSSPVPQPQSLPAGSSGSAASLTQMQQLHGPTAGAAVTGAAASSKGHKAATDLLSGSGSSQEGKARLFEINRIQSAITEVVNSGYLESVKGLRETLLVQEWGLQTKNWARRRGVSAFEEWCAVHAAAEVSYETISALYDDPDALHLLSTPRLRMMARALIEKHTLQAYEEVFHRCTTTAEGLARVGLGDLLPHTAGVGQVLRGLLPGSLPFLSASFWRNGFRWLLPFGGDKGK